MTESKKAWVTPELIVLVRSKPEEAVLSQCKGAGVGIGFSFWATGCHAIGTGCDTPCDAISAS